MKNSEKLDLLRMPAGIIPVVGTPLDIGLAGAAGVAEAEEERARLSEKMHVNIERESKRSSSRGLRKKWEEWQARWKNRSAEAAVTGIGAILGGMGIGFVAGNFAFPVIGGGIGAVIGGVVGAVTRFAAKHPKITKIGSHLVGAGAGGMAANAGYNLFVPREQDSVGIVEQIVDAQAQRQPVSDAMVAAALLANLPTRHLDRIGKDLKKKAGTQFLDMALMQGKEKEILELAQKYDTIIRADVQLLVDPKRPDQTAAEQMAELINTGQMKAENLNYRDMRILDREAPPLAQSDSLTPPMTPGRGGRGDLLIS